MRAVDGTDALAIPQTSPAPATKIVAASPSTAARLNLFAVTLPRLWDQVRFVD
ncbi:MAG: hypothetical protein IMW86_02070 [Hydrogenibacillus sp.]|nr:hypothetical protein [Hydrogenibacillus sp.]